MLCPAGDCSDFCKGGGEKKCLFRAQFLRLIKSDVRREIKKKKFRTTVCEPVAASIAKYPCL